MRVVVLLWTLLLSYSFGAYAAPFGKGTWLLKYDGESRTITHFTKANLEVVRSHSSPDGLYIGIDDTISLTFKKGGESKVIAVFVKYRHFGALDVFDTKGGEIIGQGSCADRCDMNFVSQGEWVTMEKDDYRWGSEVDKNKQRINLSIVSEEGGHFMWFGKPMKLIVFTADLQRG